MIEENDDDRIIFIIDNLIRRGNLEKVINLVNLDLLEDLEPSKAKVQEVSDIFINIDVNL